MVRAPVERGQDKVLHGQWLSAATGLAQDDLSLGTRDWQIKALDRGQWRNLMEAAVGL